MEDTKLKHRYAAELLKTNGDAYKAAFAISDDSGFALQIARDWPKDLTVKAEQNRLLGSVDARDFLPSRESQARDIYTLASDSNKDPDVRLKAHRLYAEIMNHIDKPTEGAVNILTQGVMIVRASGSDAEWQQKAIEQQRRLTSGDARPN